MPTTGRDHRGARRRQPGRPLGFQRRSLGKNCGGVGHSCHLGGRPRDRLDADRLCRGHARADADGRRRIRRAGEGRTGSDAGKPGGAAEGLHVAQFRAQAHGAEGGRAGAALARPVAGAAQTPLRRGDEPARTRAHGLDRTQAGAAQRSAADASDAVAADRRGQEKRGARSAERASGVLRALVRERRGKFDRAKARLSVEPVARRQELARERLVEFGRRGSRRYRCCSNAAVRGSTIRSGCWRR